MYILSHDPCDTLAAPWRTRGDGPPLITARTLLLLGNQAVKQILSFSELNTGITPD